MSNETDKTQINLFGQSIPPAPVAKPKPVKITLSKTLNAPLSKVIDHWLIPVFLGNWMFGDKLGNEQIINLENEVKPGGLINYKIIRDGKELCYQGQFTNLRLPSELAFQWTCSEGEPDHTTVRFEQTNDKSKIKLTYLVSSESDETPESAKHRWSTRLTALAEKLGSL